MPVKVSVVVPVYNPGVYVEDCIASLLRQSLPPDEYEVIFVDDGSTDGTPARLDALAAAEPRVTVVHQENSGWSGKPRNVGIAAARGEYVMFVDNDDYVGDEALERMYDYGVANGADVVVGKMAGKGRGVPVELFRRNHPRATVAGAPLIDSLTPHKMFRRAFLDDIGLRFPEGRRRLEDHVFVTEAYLRAGNVSVLSDYVCYYHVRRDDASNAGFRRFDPGGYFKNLREALDVVERHTEPGPLRDRLFRRWLRVEMVERLRGRRLLSLPADYRRELFEEIHRVVVERF
ncbi:glycosyltransferase family 2 protein, partial [Streptomyces sp. NPDC006356]